jgi:hypothetical protein
VTSLITDLQVDPPVEIKNYGSLLDRRYIDDQIIAIEEHLVDSVLKIGCRWFVVDSSVVGTLYNPTCVAMSGTDSGGNPTVIKATGADAKLFLGIALTAAQALSKIRIVVSGVLPPSITGIVNGGVAGYAIVDTSTGLPVFVGSLAAADIVIGRVNTAGMLSVGSGGINGVNFESVVTGTSAPSAGGAGALPATPAGYMTVKINGTTRQIAYY